LPPGAVPVVCPLEAGGATIHLPNDEVIDREFNAVAAKTWQPWSPNRRYCPALSASKRTSGSYCHLGLLRGASAR
jgi:hypothetical protein